MSKFFHSLIAIGLFFLNTVCHASANPVKHSTISLHPSDDARYINDSIAIYHTLDTLTGIEAMNLIRAGKMEMHADRTKGGLDLVDHTFWAVISLQNQSDSSIDYSLELAFNRTDHVTVFLIDSPAPVLLFHSGDVFPFKERPIDYRNFVFPINFGPHQQKDLLVNFDKRGTIDRFPLKVYPSEKFDRMRASENIIFGFFFGILSIITLVSLFLSLFLRKYLLFYYGAYAGFIGLYLLTSLGLTFQYISFNSPEWNRYNLLVLGVLACMALGRFVQSYFQTKTSSQKWHRVINGFLWVFLALISILFFLTDVVEEYKSIYGAVYYPNIFFFLTCVLILAYTQIEVSKSHAWLFIIGAFFSFSGITYALLIDLGIVGQMRVSDNALFVLFGFFGEFVFLSTALVRYIWHESKVHSPIATIQAPDWHSVPINIGMEEVSAASIEYIETFGHYLKYHQAEESQFILARQTIKEAMTTLPEGVFVRIHRYYLVNLLHVKKVTSREVLLRSGRRITVTRTYLPQVRNSYDGFVEKLG